MVHLLYAILKRAISFYLLQRDIYWPLR